MKDAGLFNSSLNKSKISNFIPIVFWLCPQHVESQFPDQGSNPCPLHWEHGVLNTGLAGKSSESFLKTICVQIWDYRYDQVISQQNLFVCCFSLGYGELSYQILCEYG